MKTIHRLAARSLLLSLAIAGITRADDAATPATAPVAATAPAPLGVPCARASIASIDAVNKVATDLGLPLPLNIQAMIEQQFPFIGTGGIDPTKPIGILMLASDDLPPSALALFAFPITPGKATLDSLKATGATPVEGETDTVAIGPAVAFKRTADYLFMYPGSAPVLKGMLNSLFASDYASPTTLAHVEINGAVARTAAPQHVQAFFQSLRTTGAVMNNSLSEHTRLATQDFLATTLAKIDLLTLDLGADKNNITLSSSISPTFAVGKREYPKPLLPADAMVTAHVVFPDAASSNWLPPLLTNLKDDDLPIPSSKLSADQLATERTTLLSLVQLLTVADAQSLSVENHAGKIIVVLVNQYDRDIDAPAEFRKDFDAMQALGKASGDTEPPVALESISPSDGSTGIRLATTKPAEGSPTAFYITQKGHVATFTLSCEANPVPSLIELSPTEKISDLGTARIDLGAVIAGGQSDDAWKRLTPAEQEKLSGYFLAKSIDFHVTSDGPANTLHLTLTIPTGVIRAAPILAGHVQN